MDYTQTKEKNYQKAILNSIEKVHLNIIKKNFKHAKKKQD